MKFPFQRMMKICIWVLLISSSGFWIGCGGGGGNNNGGITTEDEDIAANAYASGTQRSLSGAMAAFGDANGFIVLDKAQAAGSSSSFPCNVGSTGSDGFTPITCQCDNAGGTALVRVKTTASSVAQCDGGPLVESNITQDFELSFSNCELSSCNTGAVINSPGGPITGTIEYSANQCNGVTTRVASIPSGSCTSTNVTPTGLAIAVAAGPGSGPTSSVSAVAPGPTTTSGQVCANERVFAFNSLENLATVTSCLPGGSCLDISGDWNQSFVCYNPTTQFCERNDYSEFTITQPSCNSVQSDVLDVWTASNINLDTAPGTLAWTATEDVNPEGSDGGEDYAETGMWTFSDDSTMTSSSNFHFLTAPGGGPCIANATKGTPAPRITQADCEALCSGATNAFMVCP